MSAGQQRNLTLEEEAALREVAAKWPHDKQLRAEFNNDRASAEGFFKAEARGNARTFGRGVKTFESPTTRPAPGGGEPPASSPAARAAAAPAGGDRWSRDEELRLAFGNDRKIYEAFERAQASGRVKILGDSGARDGSSGAPDRSPAAPPAGAADDGAPLAGPVVSRRMGMNFSSFEDYFSWRRVFAANMIKNGELTEAEFRANMVEQWNKLVRAEAPTLASAR